MSTLTTIDRIYNFSAGPAVLPLPVLEEAQRDLVSLPGVGMSVLEISHRSKVFDAIIQGAEADFRALARIPEGYHVLFLQGGASLQFSMVPMNLLAAGTTADYVVTGSWSKKAVKEAKKVGTVNVHYTSNNTIFGTEWPSEPAVGEAPLVCDASSDIFSRPLDVGRYGLIYAGAQKNLGPSGLTI